MSGNQQFDEFDTDDDDYTEEANGVASLRRQYKAIQKANKEMENELRKLRTQSRVSTVAELLKAQNVNPKVARLIPSDVEATEDGIKEWLEDFGDIFNVSGSAPTEGDGPGVREGKGDSPSYTADDVAALTKVANASQGATVDVSKIQALIGQVNGAKSQEEFLALMEQHGVGANHFGG